MNTAHLKSFAPAVRRQLMEAVTRKLDYVLSARTPDLLTTFAPQVEALRGEATRNRSELVEKVAYTWFNRLTALRFMDARGWHPFRCRVLTPGTPEETQPELLKLTRGGALPEELVRHTNPARLQDLLEGRIPSGDAQGEVYRHLVLAACRFYHALLPDLFEKLDDSTELLLPDDLLTPQSIAQGFRTEISDEDCGEVELLGWLYQFYISEKKDAVMARKSAVPVEDIPAVTQLFTPHWIVRYLVENSLGRLWLLNRPGSGLRAHMPYYIESAPAEPPAWRPEWRKHISFQEGEFRKWMWLRPVPLSSALSADGEMVEGMSGYALTIDGYAYARNRWGMDGSDREKVKELQLAGLEKASFEDLRFCLFLIQRGIKWGSGSGPVTDLLEEFNACHAALCAAWQREWSRHTADLPDLSIVGVQTAATETDFLRISQPEDIRLCDPAAGSGHMLTYAFDLLYLIYEEEGHAPSEIPGRILRHNLHGLDICPRAAQLAELALVFKAREKSRRFFQAEHFVPPRIIELRDVRFAESELDDYIQALGLGDLFNQPILKLLNQFEEAKNFGSLIQPCLDEQAISDVRRTIEAKDLGGQLFLRGTHLKVLCALEQAEALTQRYHTITTNPPYMGSGGMNEVLRSFALFTYADSRSDLFSMFIDRGLNLVVHAGRMAMVTMESWMFLSSFEKLRESLLSSAAIQSAVHMPYLGKGGTSMGINFGTVAFVAKRSLSESEAGTFQCIRYFECDDAGIPLSFPTHNERSRVVTMRELRQVDGCPINYWVSPVVRQLFCGPTLEDLGITKRGLQPGDGPKMLRLWHEVSAANSELAAQSRADAIKSTRRWFKFDSGGPFRKWFGNNVLVVDWENNGRRIKAGKNPITPSEHLYFEPGFVWSRITTFLPSFRLHDAGIINGDVSPCFFPTSPCIEILALMNSICAQYFLRSISPTLTFLVSDILRLPRCKIATTIRDIATEAVTLSRTDWDNFETSWDFRDHPLLRPELKGATLEVSWRNWETHCTAAIRRMQELETENNRLFITAYGLEGELQPEVPEEQITLARADVRHDMAAFLSYAVGCMMGRYSLDAPGLILANAGDSLREFLAKVAIPQDQLTFAPDEDGILPVLDGEWFEDDIVARTREFLRATFGEATLRENLRFIEDSLGKDLRKYFQGDFYKDHLQTYKKRPIYWMMQSPKKGFQCLIYLHRYTRDSINHVLNRYLREYTVKLNHRLSHLEEIQLGAASTREKTAACKEADKLKKTIHECEDWERQTLLPLAQARIELDLDDGVKTNYLKLSEALAPIAGLAAKEED